MALSIYIWFIDICLSSYTYMQLNLTYYMLYQFCGLNMKEHSCMSCVGTVDLTPKYKWRKSLQISAVTY